MYKIIVAQCCIFFVIVCHRVQAQEHRTTQAHAIVIEKLMPAQWKDTAQCVVVISELSGKLIFTANKNMISGMPADIDIHDLPRGNYAMRVTAPGTLGGNVVWSTKFSKTADWEKIVIKMVPACEFDRKPEGAHKRAPNVDKPVIYLYPPQPEEVQVTLNFQGELLNTIPDYGNGWALTAYPDGTLVNKQDGARYPYLFWDGYADLQKWDMTTGFVVARDSTQSFLQGRLLAIGLSSKECGDFIDYWLPRLRQHPYNLIHFAGVEYDTIAQMTIIPKPDALLRVFMVYQPTNAITKVLPQQFPVFTRHGFTVVEWGGMQIGYTVANH